MSIPVRLLRRGSNVSAQRTAPIQDAFLKLLCDGKLDVTMFLVNGIRLQGQIRRFDNFTVMLVRGAGTQVVFKHAISAIHPAEPVQLSDPPSIEEISPQSPSHAV
jgi:host factor-I protein